MFSLHSVSIILLTVILPTSFLSAQQKEKRNKSSQFIAPNKTLMSVPPQENEKGAHSHSQAEASGTLIKLEDAINTANIGTISSFLSSKVYVSLFTGENGYFSSNQTYFILKKFFEEYRVLSFAYNSMSATSTNPYGVGQYQFLQRGIRNSAQLYISLQQNENGWRLNHITVSLRP